MPIKKITPQSKIEQHMQQAVDKQKTVLTDVFCYVGESCVIEARNGGTYKDQTGNLRSSIGYVVLDDGRVCLKGGFQKTKQGGNGASEGDKFMSQLIAKNKKGIILIVVAGMNYAACVEAKGYNVITSAELLAKQLVPQMMQQLGFVVK